MKLRAEGTNGKRLVRAQCRAWGGLVEVPVGGLPQSLGSEHQRRRVARHFQVAPAHQLLLAVPQFAQALPVHGAG